ncbi:MAG TPA: isoprenylcysteine carboxylmethyltransferase family protein [Methanotrichaceae archaeon]|nr:isoprenylcysteine carboxylmethyltransferase family protein [Methanotrichaceae archaeon]
MARGVLALCFVIFAALHSLLADMRAKSLVRRTFGPSSDHWYRPAYVAISFLTLIPVAYLLASAPQRVLYKVSAPLSWLMMALQALSALALLGALMQTGLMDFLGIKPRIGPGRLITGGFYCHLRNPLFFFGMTFIWLTPFMTDMMLVLYSLITIYFYVGALHEERSLLAEFGAEYAEYRRRIPMFIPRLRCR